MVSKKEIHLVEYAGRYEVQHSPYYDEGNILDAEYIGVKEAHEIALGIQHAFNNTVAKGINPNCIPNIIEALNKIADWDLPHRDYEMNYGSNGARDYIKNIAKEALENCTLEVVVNKIDLEQRRVVHINKFDGKPTLLCGATIEADTPTVSFDKLPDITGIMWGVQGCKECIKKYHEIK